MCFIEAHAKIRPRDLDDKPTSSDHGVVLVKVGSRRRHLNSRIISRAGLVAPRMSSFPELSDLCELVVRAADHTGLSSIGLRATHSKGDGSFVTEFDHQLQAFMLSELSASWSEYSFLGEEMEHGEQAEVVGSERSGFWVLDPLDGTTNFAMGFPFTASRSRWL